MTKYYVQDTIIKKVLSEYMHLQQSALYSVQKTSYNTYICTHTPSVCFKKDGEYYPHSGREHKSIYK